MGLKSLLSICLIVASLAVANAQDQVKLDSLQRQLSASKEDTTKIKTLLELANIFLGENYLKAAEYAKTARELSLKKGLPAFECRANRVLANVFMGMGDYEKASTHYFNALKYYEEAHDTLGALSMNNNLGTVYDRLGEFDKALAYYFKAQDQANPLNIKQQSQFLPGLYNNIANIYQSKGDTHSALQYYEKSLLLAEKTNNKNFQGITLNNLGKLYLFDIKEYDKALEYLSRGLIARQEIGDKAEISKSYNFLAVYYRQTGNLEEARKAVDEAIQLGSEIGSLEALKNGYSVLSEIEMEEKHFEKSLQAYKEFKYLNDSLQSQEAHSEITRLQLQYDFEKAEQSRELERKQTRLKYISIIVVMGVGLILAIMISILIRLRARQTELKRKNLAQDVEIKNKELTTNVIYLIRKNELINDVAERLLKMQNNLHPENHKVIHEIIIDLQNEADNDVWKEFELRFNQVHSEFYKNIRKLYPSLSPADEKLCAFLRLNMSSKEIAAITQQSIKSVEVARARLRKKLNLTNTNSNLVTHLSGL